MNIIISIGTTLKIEKIVFNQRAHETYETELRFDFRFSCDLRGRFTCILLHSDSDRVGLLRSSEGLKLTSIIERIGTTASPERAEHRMNPLPLASQKS